MKTMYVIGIKLDKSSLKFTDLPQQILYLKIKSSWEVALVGRGAASRFETHAIAEFVSESFWSRMIRERGTEFFHTFKTDHTYQEVKWTRQVIPITVRKLKGK